jgi:YHS domain-containing protein
MAKAKDPICGMMVDTEKAPAKGTYDGQTVYFCAESCKRTYEAKRKPK